MMLMFSSFILLILAVAGQDDCDFGSPYEKCYHYIPKDKLRKIHIVPNENELEEICPDQLSYFECFTEHIEECGPMGEHFTVIEFMENSYEIARDLCNEFSQLHRDYVASADCYNSLDGVGQACEEEAKEIYRNYFEFLEREHPSRAEAVHKSSQKICMVESYKTACLSEKVLKECGELAQSTMMEVIVRSQYLRQFCSQSMVDELKTTFLNFVDMEEDDLEIYRNTFYGMSK